VSGSAVSIVTSADWSVTPSVQELEQMFQLGDRIVGSVRF